MIQNLRCLLFCTFDAWLIGFVYPTVFQTFYDSYIIIPLLVPILFTIWHILFTFIHKNLPEDIIAKTTIIFNIIGFWLVQWVVHIIIYSIVKSDEIFKVFQTDGQYTTLVCPTFGILILIKNTIVFCLTPKQSQVQSLLNKCSKVDSCACSKSATQCERCPCAICYSNLDQNADIEMNLINVILRTPCNHYFHRNCLKEWYKKSNTCPICRS
jgi:hypothetical protein